MLKESPDPYAEFYSTLFDSLSSRKTASITEDQHRGLLERGYPLPEDIVIVETPVAGAPEDSRTESEGPIFS